MPKPNKGETKDEYLQRCMSDSEMQKYSQDQRYLLCNVYWKEVKLESYTDYPQAATENAKIALRWAEKNGWGECGTAVGKQRANQYIISARSDKKGMLSTAKLLNIPESRVYATGSNKAKVEKIKELGIDKHYDNNPDVISELPNIGILFK